MTHCPIEAFVRPGPAGGASHVVCGQWLNPNRPARALPPCCRGCGPRSNRQCQGHALRLATGGKGGATLTSTLACSALRLAPTGHWAPLGTRVIVARSRLGVACYWWRKKTSSWRLTVFFSSSVLEDVRSLGFSIRFCFLTPPPSLKKNKQ